MIIANFSVKNFRSISAAYKLLLGDYSVIVGPNNEGKSNILRAMSLSLEFFKKTQEYISRWPSTTLRFANIRAISDYRWEIDCPLHLQTKNTSNSEFTFEFQFSDEEITEFKDRTNINLTKSLKIKLTFGQKNWSIDFLKSGKGKKNLVIKKNEIINFLADKLVVQYIPSIRTPELSGKIVSNLLEKEFDILSAQSEFKFLQQKLDTILKDLFTKISSSITPMVSSFIPDVQKVTILNARGLPSLLSASSLIKVDDGTETELKAKGDGIISLTAISLLKHISEESKGKKNIILLIEEPESHLHPDGIHRLKQLLSDLDKNQQVVITTHSPIMINRADIRRNIIVQNKKAIPAKKVDDIRSSLGIHVSDNLTTAYLILLTEGIKDVRLLSSWLAAKSNIIESSIKNGNFKIDSLEGVANLSYKSSFYKNILCNIHVFTDDDEEARKAIQIALDKNIIKNGEYNVCSCVGMKNSELEDAIKFEDYEKEIAASYGVQLLKSSMSRGNKVWSEKIKIFFEHKGKIWSNSLENELKDFVVSMAVKNGIASLDESKCKSIGGLIESIEVKLKKGIK